MTQPSTAAATPNALPARRSGWCRCMPLLALALAACGGEEEGATPPPAPATIPPALLGDWSGQAGCGPDALRVASDFIHDGGTVRRIDLVSRGGAGVDVDTSASVDGITSGKRYRLVPGDSGALMVTVDGNTTMRLRCR